VIEPQTAEPTDRPMRDQILVAGIGNVFLGDDGFGAAVTRRLRERELPGGVSVFDFGTGGLKLAYEVMRGYSGLVLVDVSRQGGEPGTLYVMDADPEDVSGEIADGDALDPHGMDPRTVLRFVKAIAGWPGRVVIVACEPAELGADGGMTLSGPVAEAVDRAVEVVLETLGELRSELAAGSAGGSGSGAA
jgi:hydrogenase maturation protease